MDVSRALVVGVNGSVGQLMARNLTQSGISVFGIDINEPPEESHGETEYLCADFLISSSATTDLVRQSDCILLCVPSRIALGCLDWVAGEVSPDSLIVDTLSVKSEIAKKLETINKPFEYLSINPLFAPSLGFVRHHVAAVSIRPGSLSRHFLQLLESWGAVVSLVSTEMHDRSMSAVQVATHIVLIAYGLVLQKLGYDPSQSRKLWTPPHTLVLCLLARILTSSPDVYWDIQKSNPFAEETRELFVRVIEQLNSTITSDSQPEFSQIFSVLRSMMEQDCDPLAQVFTEIVSGKMLPS